MSSLQDTPATADLCDVHIDKLQILDPAQVKLANYGGIIKFGGRITTVKCLENNPLVRSTLGEPGEGRVLVVDGQGSLRRAVMGDNIAELAVKNRWAGVIINGAIRDSAQIATMPLGVKAVGTNPLKSLKEDPGEKDVAVSFGGVTFPPGGYVYADADGVIVSEEALSLP